MSGYNSGVLSYQWFSGELRTFGGYTYKFHEDLAHQNEDFKKKCGYRGQSKFRLSHGAHPPVARVPKWLYLPNGFYVQADIADGIAATCRRDVLQITSSLTNNVSKQSGLSRSMASATVSTKQGGVLRGNDTWGTVTGLRCTGTSPAFSSCSGHRYPVHPSCLCNRSLDTTNLQQAPSRCLHSTCSLEPVLQLDDSQNFFQTIPTRPGPKIFDDVVGHQLEFGGAKPIV